jgi:hypothetical protein
MKSVMFKALNYQISHLNSIDTFARIFNLIFRNIFNNEVFH